LLESRRTSLSAFLTLICGCLLLGVSIAGSRSDAIHTVDQLAIFEALWPNEILEKSAHHSWERAAEAVPTFTIARIMKFLTGISVVVIAASLLGIAGTISRHKNLVCTYVLLASCLSACVLLNAAQATQRKSVAEPLIRRQVFDLCNASTYVRLGRNLNCEWSKELQSLPLTPCMDVCQWRVQLLEHMSGCSLLPRLCKKFEYQPLAQEACAATVTSGKTSAEFVAGLSECQDRCDQDITCTDFAHQSAMKADSGRCTLFGRAFDLSLPSAGVFAEKTLAQDDGDRHCYRRVQPTVLRKFSSHEWYICVCTVALGALLVMSSACTCCLMYNVNIDRRGQPTGLELACMMFCPACADRIHRRYYEDYFKEELGDLDDSTAPRRCGPRRCWPWSRDSDDESSEDEDNTIE